jgi:hypothetical protein
MPFFLGRPGPVPREDVPGLQLDPNPSLLATQGVRFPRLAALPPLNLCSVRCCIQFLLISP